MSSRRFAPSTRFFFVAALATGIKGFSGIAETRIQAPSSFAGVRLVTGVAASVLGVGADELLDQRVDLDVIWGSAGAELRDRLSASVSDGERRDVLAAAVRRRVGERHVDQAVMAAARLLAH